MWEYYRRNSHQYCDYYNHNKYNGYINDFDNYEDCLNYGNASRERKIYQ